MDIGSLLYFGALALWSWWIASMLIKLFPKKAEEASAPAPSSDAAFPAHVPAPAVPEPLPQAPLPDYQLTEGFKAFQSGAELTVEDIVKGLSRRG